MGRLAGWAKSRPGKSVGEGRGERPFSYIPVADSVTGRSGLQRTIRTNVLKGRATIDELTRKIILEALTGEEKMLFEEFLSGLEQGKQELVGTKAARRIERADALGQPDRLWREGGVFRWHRRVGDDQTD